jgi:hypothetical protein
MPTRGSDGNGIATVAKEVADHANAIARLEVELAKLELKQKAAGLAGGIGLGAGAAVLALFGLAFLLAAAGAGLALTLDPWLALLVLGGALVLVAALLAAIALASIRKATPPVPEQAIREAKLTQAAIKR